MKNTFFGLMLMVGGMFTFPSCSNDIAEEAMEDFTQGIQPGTPMNFALDFGGSQQKTDKSGKRRISYDDKNSVNGPAAFKFEVGDKIGVECPDAEKDNEDLEREGRASKGIYEVQSLDNAFGMPNFAQDLKALNTDRLYWSKANLHRVFAACPAGKVTLGPIQGEDDDFTRSFETSIDATQNGVVTVEEIKVDNNTTEEGYRCVDKTNMVHAGSWCYYREDISEESMAYLPIPMNACFTSLDVIFKKQESAKNVTIKSVSVKVKAATDGTVSNVKIAGKCTGTVTNGRDGFIVISQVNPDPSASDKVTLKLGENGYKWAQDKPLSTVLIMFPWPEPNGAGSVYNLTFPAQLQVVYQYEGEDEQTKYMDISGTYGINARNRVIVPALPHGTSSN